MDTYNSMQTPSRLMTIQLVGKCTWECLRMNGLIGFSLKITIPLPVFSFIDA